MGVDNLHAVGATELYYAEDEATYAAFTRATATGAFRAMEVEIAETRGREYRHESRQTRWEYARYAKQVDCTWNAKGQIWPSGTAGTPPDMDLLFRSILGTRTVSGGTSVTYAPSNTQGAGGSFTLTKWATTAMWALTGCVAQSMKISFGAGEDCLVEFTGPGSRVYYTGYSTLSANMAGSDQMSVQTADQGAFEINSIVSIDDSTNTGTGYRVTAGTANPFTVEANVTESSGAVVAPYVPTPTIAGAPLSGVEGSVSIDSLGAFPITGFEVEVKQNLRTRHLALARYASDQIEGWGSIEGRLVLPLRADQTQVLGRIHTAEATTRDLAIAIGTAAGYILTINLDQAEFGDPQIRKPDDGTDLEAEIPFFALASAATTANGIALIFT